MDLKPIGQTECRLQKNQQQQLRSSACGRLECKDDISAFHWYSDNSETFFVFLLEGVMYEFDCVKVNRFGATAFVATLNW